MSRKDRRNAASPLASATAERLAAIVEAAERAAAEVIDDAETQARHYLEQAQAEADRLVAERLGGFAELTDALVVQVEEFRRQADRLLASLEEVKAEAEGAPSRVSHLKAVTPVAEAPPVATEPAPLEDLDRSAGARLLATQMAVSGSSREEIAARLRNGFEIEDTAAILDAILGPED